MNIENEGGRIGVATLVKLLTNDYEIHSEPTSYAPTEGRVIEDSSTGQIWIGDGSNWIDVENDVYFDNLVPGLRVRNLIGEGGVAGQLGFHDGTDNVNVNPKGLAQRVNGNWVSLVNGETIE